ncbi:hypothetical protein LTR09_012502 [Extremus antarcticus]|uniref:HNH nuclease domain-containing protein n=1 Tax=Extremus antarcticus TaxID=702011 RepID=A0AAJ0D9Y6_9PEZI|nr:hypothetical protein LTR09_012502 [Extremus antarcticus]
MPLALRPPLEPPRTPDPVLHPARVSIRHPAYDASSTLLEFDAVDADEDGRPGVVYAVVHTSAAIVANNEFEGWLSTSKSGDVGRVELAAGDVLVAGVYFFHVPTFGDYNATSGVVDLDPYPVVPSFRHWCFPSHLPEGWSSAGIGVLRSHQDVRARDESCLVTRHGLVTSVAHIVPAAEGDWFRANEMFRFRTYTPEGQPIIDRPENLLLLRQDLHFAWDRMDFSLLPKQNTGGSWEWTLHAHTFSLDELHTLYHNRVLHPIKGVSRQFLFARFAWDIFPRLRNFLSAGANRRLKTSGGVAYFAPEELRSFCEGQGRNRSLSPKKGGSPSKRARQRSEACEADCHSFDSGIGGIRRKGSSDEHGALHYRVESEQRSGYETDHAAWSGDWAVSEGDPSGLDLHQCEWSEEQKEFDCSLQDPCQDELEGWKVRSGLTSIDNGTRALSFYDQRKNVTQEHSRMIGYTNGN